MAFFVCIIVILLLWSLTPLSIVCFVLCRRMMPIIYVESDLIAYTTAGSYWGWMFVPFILLIFSTIYVLKVHRSSLYFKWLPLFLHFPSSFCLSLLLSSSWMHPPYHSQWRLDHHVMNCSSLTWRAIRGTVWIWIHDISGWCRLWASRPRYLTRVLRRSIAIPCRHLD